MKKNYLIVSLVQAFIIIASALLVPVTAHSQDLTAEQKQERCQNNKNKIAALKAQLGVIDAELSKTMTKEENEDKRTQMTFVRSMKNLNSRDAATWYHFDKIAAQYNFEVDKCNASEDASTACIIELEKIIAKKIDKANSLNRPALLAKKNEIDKQLSNHRNNLIALGCEQTSNTQINCYPGSHPANNPQTNRTECFCNPGLVWNSTRTACVDPQELVKNTNCSAYPGSYAAWNAQTQRVECWCPSGKTWNSTMTACIDAGKDNTVPNTGCTATEAATFAKMTGSWKSYRMHVTIGGSCDKVTGTWKVTEWCEGVDETYNATVARVNGTLSGKMQNGYLQLSFESPPSPNNSKGSKGSGSCSINSDGTLNCSGFGCTGDLKKQ